MASKNTEAVILAKPETEFKSQSMYKVSILRKYVFREGIHCHFKFHLSRSYLSMVQRMPARSIFQIVA